MRATFSLPELLRISSHHKDDCLLVVHNSQCFLRSEGNGVHLESILDASDIEPGQMLIPRSELKALNLVDDSEITFFEDGSTWGYRTPLGASCVDKGSFPRPSTPPGAIPSLLVGSSETDQVRVLPSHLLRRGLRILRDCGSVQVLDGMMVAARNQEGIIVRSASFESLAFDIVAAAVKPLLRLLTSNSDALVRKSAGMTVVQVGETALGWSTPSEKPFDLKVPQPICRIRLLRSDLQRLLRLAVRSKQAVIVGCDPKKAELYVEKERGRFPLKMRVLGGSPVRILVHPLDLLTHVNAMKGVEIEVAMGSRWVQLRGAEVVPRAVGEMLEISTLFLGAPLPFGPEP